MTNGTAARAGQRFPVVGHPSSEIRDEGRFKPTCCVELPPVPKLFLSERLRESERLWQKRFKAYDNH